jgi:hypothetical protein
MVALCWVCLTGTFLNMVASRSFIDRSSNGFDVPSVEQRQCHESKIIIASKSADFPTSPGLMAVASDDRDGQFRPCLSSYEQD